MLYSSMSVNWHFKGMYDLWFSSFYYHMYAILSTLLFNQDSLHNQLEFLEDT
jgi:hypothetical protein